MRSPRPRARPRAYEDVVYWTGETVVLPPPTRRRADLFRVLARRRTALPREPLELTELSTLLWYTAKVWSHRGKRGEANYWEHRAVPSAGGCHPVDLLVRGGELASSWHRYDGYSHLFAPIRVRDAAALAAFDEELQSVAGSPGRCTQIWFLSIPDRTTRRYTFAGSLIWRDCGVLVGMLSVLSESLSMACTPIGWTGSNLLPMALGVGGRVASLGGVLVGRR